MKCRIYTWRFLAVMNFAAAGLVISGNYGGAQVVNFDVPGGLGRANYSGQGAVSDLGDNYWNPVVNDGTTSGSLLSNGVNSSPITLSDNSPNSYNPGQGVQGTPAGLEAPFLYENSGFVITNMLNNVPRGSDLTNEIVLPMNTAIGGDVYPPYLSSRRIILNPAVPSLRIYFRVEKYSLKIAP